VRRYRLRQEELAVRIKEALAEVKTLSGLLPICAWCKKIRNDRGYWEQLEGYFLSHSHITFSHGICEECEKKYTPESDADPTDVPPEAPPTR
jgi:hypothetical protein